jgi:hypothetical protein
MMSKWDKTGRRAETEEISPFYRSESGKQVLRKWPVS